VHLTTCGPERRSRSLSSVPPELQERILGSIKNAPELQDAFHQLLAVREEDFGKIHAFLSRADWPTNVEMHRFFNELLVYLPIQSRITPWVCLVSVWGLASTFNVAPQEVLRLLHGAWAPDKNVEPLLSFVSGLDFVFDRMSTWSRQLSYAVRNERFLTNILTASDLRAVYTQDFSLVSTPETYDSVVDLQTLIPVAKIRLVFNNNLADFVDFACDLNALTSLIHGLSLTRRQLEGLLEVSGMLNTTKNDAQRDK